MHEKNFLEKRSKQDLIKLCEYKSYNITQLINKLDNHISHKIHYIAISASNFSNAHNQKTLSILDYENDKKFKALNEKLQKVRDKYGVDIIKYGRELTVGV